MDDLERAARLLADRTRILVFTGAGISTESGIPDFRGPQGLWRKVDPADFTLRRWVTDGDFRTAAWSRRFGNERDGYAPNAAHRAVVTLWETGRMVGCVTQNIDGLHQMAGLPPEAVAELHGNAQGIVCYERRHPADPDQVATRWAAGESDPRCEVCDSILKSTTVLFGEQLPVAAVSRAQQWADDADAVLVIGSTLGVYPAADYPLQVAARGEPFVIVNQGPTDHDGLATLRVDGKAGAVVPALVAALAG